MSPYILYPKEENLILNIGIIRNLFLILNIVPGTRQATQAGGRRQGSASASLIPGSGGFWLEMGSSVCSGHENPHLLKPWDTESLSSSS